MTMTNPASAYAVPRARLGLTDIHIPVIGQGTYKYNGGVEPLRYGIDLGATLIDTAEIYGTESVVGDACASRLDIVIITKLWKTHNAWYEVGAALAESTNWLGRKPDIYMYHFPSDVPIKETMFPLSLLCKRGHFKHLGICNLTLDQLKEAQDCLEGIRIEAVQYRYNLNRREVENDILPYCRDNDITFMAYEPLDQGRLAGKAKEALRFIVKEGCVAIVRSGNKDHIKANIEAVCEVGR